MSIVSFGGGECKKVIRYNGVIDGMQRVGKQLGDAE